MITRSEAKERGLKRYFTGDPCPAGHIADRLVSNGSCHACRMIRLKDWKARNPDKKAAANLRWQRSHRDDYNSYTRERSRKATVALRALSDLGIEV